MGQCDIISKNNAGTVQYMKKAVVLVFLAAIVMLSACVPFMQGFYNAVPNTKISESLISRMKNNTDTHSIEGFTAESTFGDCLENIGVTNARNASISFYSGIFGYPAVVRCSFMNYSGKLLLNDMHFYVAPGGKKDDDKLVAKELLAKLDNELGSCDKQSDADGITNYIWEKDGWKIRMSVYEDGWEPDSAAGLSVYAPFVVMGKFPEIPDIFPYQLGAGIDTVFQDIIPHSLPDDFDDSGSIEYLDEGINIRLQFKTDEAGAVKLSSGSYDADLNNMDIKGSLGFYESLADGLENAMGAPKARGYGIPDVQQDGMVSYGGSGGGQGMSAEDILNSGTKVYWFEINWPCIDFIADYEMGTSLHIDFYEEYLGGTANE